ncbi:hypothetical protein K144313037_01560 [Clostridium tetani]|uniref:hypothetical protein n=1 Tax=Clostridium tetani TaxID=1513 RepID=UPI000D1FDED6|nr:hypothetical protein [Clostridium tetani]AVP55535.1 hypothetical protein C3B72_10415 [Clostridium tetani]RXI77417.1 hypothetical protein DP128_03055 [Clostridium tetani]WFN62177.1 hypothetical protein PAA20_01640 [Clostridium tetani]SUY54350.1 comf operon protein A, DNA transporter ATPase [Clostridium tetani]BDR68744.1 hypothetical protein K144313037_01560 [Clostridium tetani]
MFIKMEKKNHWRLEKISNYLKTWIFSKEKLLNIVTVPSNSSSILVETILTFANNDRKVLYITEEEEDIDIILNIKKVSDFKEYSHIKDTKSLQEKKLLVCNAKIALQLEEKFDLVIFDDINKTSELPKKLIKQIIERSLKVNGKGIAYSIEPIFINKRDIVLPLYKNSMPVIEPRIITTKVDLNQDIPYMIYEYLRWTIELNKKVLIYVPDSYRLKNVYNYFENNYKNISKNIFYYSKKDGNIKILSNFQYLKKAIIITDDLNGETYNIRQDKNTNIMVFFADDDAYNYKNLIYFCGEMAFKREGSMKEVIFVCNEETNEIDKTKQITREFNKEAWEMGLLSI